MGRHPLTRLNNAARHVFAQRFFQPWELPSIMRKHIYTGAMGMTYFYLTSGMFLVALGEHVGMKYWQWGMMGAGCSFALSAQLVSAHWSEIYGRRKLIWFVVSVLSRLLRSSALFLAILLYPIAPGLARGLLIVLIVLASAFSAMGLPPWLSWLADLIPEKEHGRFWGRRSAWIALAAVSVIVPLGYFFDSMPESRKLDALAWIFGIAFVIGMADLFIHGTIPEPPVSRQSDRSFWRRAARPLRDKDFRPWLLFNCSWNFSMTLGGSLATVYFVHDLGVEKNFLIGTIVLIGFPLIASVFTGKIGGILTDRYGVVPVLRWAHRCWATLPLYWLVATPAAAPFWLGLGALVGGASSAAAMTAATKLITRFRASNFTPMYTAISSTLGSLAAGFGPLVAGFVLEHTRGWSATVAGHRIVGFHLLFAASLTLRFLSTLLIGRIKQRSREPETEPTNRSQ